MSLFHKNENESKGTYYNMRTMNIPNLMLFVQFLRNNNVSYAIDGLNQEMVILKTTTGSHPIVVEIDFRPVKTYSDSYYDNPAKVVGGVPVKELIRERNRALEVLNEARQKYRFGNLILLDDNTVLLQSDVWDASDPQFLFQHVQTIAQICSDAYLYFAYRL